MSLLRIACSLTLAPLHCQWSFDDGSAARVIGEGTPGQVPQDLVKRAGHIHLMVRAAQVLITRTQLPVATGRRPDSLLAYAVEDKTASEPDANQVTRLGSAGGADVVAVVDRKALESWRMALGSAGIRSFEVRAETLMLPLLAGQWSVAWDGREGFVRSGALEGGATDCGDRGSPPLSLLLMLDEARARDEAPDSIALYLTAPDALPDLAEWQRRLGVALLPAQHWDWRSAPAQPGIDLGTERRKWRFDPGLGSRLRPIAWIASIALGIHVSALAADWARLASGQKALRAQMESTFRAAFPESVAVADPVLQMRRKLAEARHAAGRPDGGDFAPMISTVAAGLKDLPPGALQAVSFEGGRMALELRNPDPLLLGRIGARFVAAGLGVETGPAVLRTDSRSIVMILSAP